MDKLSIKTREMVKGLVEEWKKLGAHEPLYAIAVIFEQMLQHLDALENAVTWNVDCPSCAKYLDQIYELDQKTVPALKERVDELEKRLAQMNAVHAEQQKIIGEDAWRIEDLKKKALENARTQCPYCDKQREPGHRTCGSEKCLSANFKTQTGRAFGEPRPKSKEPA